MPDKSVEMPSDFRTVFYLESEDSGAYKIKLAREMKRDEPEVDMNKLY